MLVIFGCSIQKRQHTGGYYIQWHKRYHSSEGKREKQKLQDTIADVVDLDTIVERDTIIAEVKIDSIVSNDEPIAKHEKLPPLPRKERKFEPLGVLAFKILLGDVLVGILGENSADHKTIVQLEILFLIILLISFVLGVVSMIRYLRNPRHYRFNIFAIIAILVPLFYLVEFILGNYVLAIDFKSF